MPHCTPGVLRCTPKAASQAGSEGARTMSHPHSSSRWLGWGTHPACCLIQAAFVGLAGVGDSPGMLLGSGGLLRCRLVLPALTVPSKQLDALWQLSLRLAQEGVGTITHPHLSSCWLGWGTHPACCLVGAAFLGVGWCCRHSLHPLSNLVHCKSSPSGSAQQMGLAA